MRLIDADALRADYFVTSTTTNTPLYRYVSMEQIANAPTVEPASPWHRCEDELPKDRETVLVYCENTGGIVKSHYHEFMGSGGNQHYWFSGGTYHPKYWMPLPEPPKEDA